MPSRTQAKPPAFSIKDALFILYRHKWKIILLTLIGLSGAAWVYLNQKPVYQSNSELLVRYVVDRSSVDSFEEQGGVGARYSDFILGTEKKILTSIDLAYDVAERLGVDVVLPHIAGEKTLSQAASLIRKGLQVTTVKKTNVMEVAFQHPEKDQARLILKAILKRYYERHLEIRRSTSMQPLLASKVKEAEEQLKETEEKLHDLKQQGGILDYEKSVTALEEKRSALEQALISAKAELASQEARLVALERLQKIQNSEGEQESSAQKDASVTPAAPKSVHPQIRLDYQDLAKRLSDLRSRRLVLLQKYTATNSQVILVEQQIAEVQSTQNEYLKRYPGLLSEPVSVASNRRGPDQRVEMQSYLPSPDLQRTTVDSARARVGSLSQELNVVLARMTELSTIGGKINKFNRKAAIELKHLEDLRSTFERSRLDGTLSSGEIPNISQVQTPTPPVAVVASDNKVLIMGLAASGLVLGLGWAFLKELLLDRRVKRPLEIESRLEIPLMLSIPRLTDREQRKLLTGPGGEPISGHFIHPFANAIRDRLFYNFEIENLHHRPKLIAVSGLTEGAGTSTVAGGLANALQGAGEAKVLLIDMTRDEIRTLESGQSPELLEEEQPPAVDPRLTQRIPLKAALAPVRRESSDALFLASGSTGSDGRGKRQLAPRKLFEMLPEFRRSDFDYIVFDLPPMGPLSPSVAMAGIMDQVLLVLDAQNTNRADLKKTFSDLSKGNAKVSTIFNKTRPLAPSWLEG